MDVDWVDIDLLSLSLFDSSGFSVIASTPFLPVTPPQEDPTSVPNVLTSTGIQVRVPQLSTPPDPAILEDLSHIAHGVRYYDYDQPDTLTVSMSNTFHPAAALLPNPTDMMFLSSDGVLFAVHWSHIDSMSANHFNHLLYSNAQEPEDRTHHPANDAPDVVLLPEVSSVLNIILHVLYDRSCAYYHPRLETLVSSVDAMPTYGVSPKQHVAPSTQLYSLLLNQAPLQPILVYAVAASHNLPELAVAVSNHLLSYQLASLSNELAMRIGPLYMKRLFFLHLGRIEALKRLLLAPPHPHSPTSFCDFAEQKKLTRAWTLASAYLAWDARPDMTVTVIERALCPLADHLDCDICQQTLAGRVKELVTRWSMVKIDIAPAGDNSATAYLFVWVADAALRFPSTRLRAAIFKFDP